MNFLEPFEEMLFSSLEVPVEYVRGENRYPIMAVRAGVSWNAIQRLGEVALESSARDFIIRKNSIPITPQPKDKIMDGEKVWTVFSQLDEECWRPVGDSGMIRVHCRQTE